MRRFRLLHLLPLFMLVFFISTVQAQDSAPEPNNYIVHAGLSGQGGIRLLAFLPMTLQVHQGDTVTWVFGGGLHNVRFTEEAGWTGNFIVPAEVDGATHLIFDPNFGYRTLESGGTFTGEPINSGIHFDHEHSAHAFDAEAPYSFTIVVDAEPGGYVYICDIHPGMVGTIEVVADDVAIPSPFEVSEQVSAITAEVLDEATRVMYEFENGSTLTSTDGAISIMAGHEFIHDRVRIAIDRFFPSTAVIHAGETVTWSVADDATVGHAIVSPYLGFSNYTSVLVDAEGNNQLEFSPLALFPTLADGVWDPNAEYVHAGIAAPGAPVTVTFNDPGQYIYSDVFEPGMTGTVVVLPAE
jgi:plastocyanin